MSSFTPFAELQALPKRTHYLHAGNIYASAEPAIVTTILGSCVAVCLWDERSRIGGINHFLLPQRINTHHGAAHFGTTATNALIEELVALGAQLRSLRAKVFGGASIFGAGNSIAIGAKNAEVAISILRERGIPVVASSIGGARGRKIIFHTDSGDLYEKVF